MVIIIPSPLMPTHASQNAEELNGQEDKGVELPQDVLYRSMS